MIFKLFRRNGEAITAKIQVGRIDLVRIACKDYFSALASTTHNSLNLVWGEILYLINKDELEWNGAATHVRNCLKADNALLLKSIDDMCVLLRWRSTIAIVMLLLLLLLSMLLTSLLALSTRSKA